MTRKTVLTKTCLNPHCGKKFECGHYGLRQQVCRGTYEAKCGKCKGSGKREGDRCFRCLGKGAFKETCRNWYKGHWGATRKPPSGIPPKDLQRILNEALKRHDLAMWSYIVVAAESGLRKGEQLGLTWGDVLDQEDKVENNILIVHQWDDREGMKTTKTDEARTAYLREPAQKALKFLHARSLGAKRDQRVWEISEVKVWSKFKRLQRQLGIVNPETKDGYKVHALRHTAAINTYKATGDIQNATILLGHKDPATTMIYTQQRPEEFVAKLDKAFKRKRLGELADGSKKAP